MPFAERGAELTERSVSAQNFTRSDHIAAFAIRANMRVAVRRYDVLRAANTLRGVE
jgi:hypothetical protein